MEGVPAAVERRLGLTLKLAFYVLTSWIGLIVFSFVLGVAGYLIASVGTVFGAAIVANALSTRVFERLPVTAIGLGWHNCSARNVVIGTILGVLAAGSVTLLPVAVRTADLIPDSSNPGSLGTFLFITLVLVFGAIGEELLFRGYGFQTLVRIAGNPGSLIVTGILFGCVHMQNLHATPLGIVNTAGFGIIFGYAFLRTGELWLPIGIHFGWNWMLSLAGAAVSGFKMGVTGYQLRWKVAEIWSGGEYGPEASILTCAVIIVLLVLIHKLPLRRVEAPLLTMQDVAEVSPEA